MEPLTALSVLSERYGTGTIANALTGGSDTSRVTGELTTALETSEDRMGVRLLRIGTNLLGPDQPLIPAAEQHFDHTVDAGKHQLRIAVGYAIGRQRVARLSEADHRFRAATTMAATPLRRALIHRYLFLTAVLLGHPDAAATALTEIRTAATLSALHLSRNVYQATASVTAHDHATVGGRRAGHRSRTAIAERRTRIHDATLEGARLIEQLFAEIQIMEHVLGQPLSAAVRPLLAPLFWDRAQWHGDTTKLVWFAEPPRTGLIITRVGAITVRWEHLGISRVHRRDPARHAAPQYGWSYVADPHRGPAPADLAVTVRAAATLTLTPALPVPLEIRIQPPGHPATALLGTRRQILDAGTNSVRHTGRVVVAADRHGAPVEPIEVHLGTFLLAYPNTHPRLTDTARHTPRPRADNATPSVTSANPLRP